MTSRSVKLLLVVFVLAFGQTEPISLLAKAADQTGEPTAVSEAAAQQPEPPALPEDTAAEVAELDAEIKVLEEFGLTAPTQPEQDAALDEALELAERVVALRNEHQGNSTAMIRWRDANLVPSEWYEVMAARRRVWDLRHLRGATIEQRQAASEAVEKHRAGKEAEARGNLAKAEPLFREALAMWQHLFPGDHPKVALGLSNLAFVLHSRGDLGGAEPLCRDALAMRQRLFSGDHPDVASSLNNLASILRARGDLAGAEPMFRDALAMQQRLFPGDHPNVASSLNNLGGILHRRGDLGEAEPLFREALAMTQRLFPGDHQAVALGLHNLAFVAQTRGDLGGAESLYRDALAMRQRLFSGDHPDVASSLHSLASILHARGDLAGAEPMFRDALAMRQRLFLGDHPDVAYSLNNLASILHARGELGEAEPLFRDALAMRQRLFSGDHPEVASSLNNLAGFMKDRGALPEAEPLFREALAMTQRLYPGDHPHLATCLNNVADILQDRGDLVGAELLFRDALAMWQRLFLGDHPYVALSLNNVAGILHARGDLAGAESLYRDALAMFQRLFPGDHPNVALSLNNLAGFLRDRGDLAGAEPLFRNALAMWQRLFPGDHPYVAISLNNLAGILNDRGDLAGAELLYREALAMRQRLFPGDHPSVASNLNNLAGILNTRANSAGAEPLGREALAMRQRLFPGDDPGVAASLNNLAGILNARGDPAGAELLYRDALAMWQRLFPGDHPSVAISLNNLAGILKERGDLAGAEPLFQDALAMWQRVFPGDNANVAIGLQNVANTLHGLGDLAGAEPLFRHALAMTEHLRTDVIGGPQERAVLAGWLDLAGIASDYARLLVQTDRAGDALGVLERGRSRAALDLLIGAVGEAETALRAHGDAERIARYELAMDREQTALVAIRDAEAKVAAAPDKEARASLREKVEHRRRELGDRTAEVLVELRGLIPAGDAVTTDEVLAALEPGEALLSFSWRTDGVVALVALDGAINGVTLAQTPDEVSRIADALASARGAIANRPEGGRAFHTRVLTIAQEMLLDEALMSLLADASSLTVIADGPLHGVPLELLIEDTPIAYAPSAAIALDRRRAGERRDIRPAGVVILGDPDFGNVEESNYPKSGALVTSVQRGSNADIAGLQRGDVLLTYGTHDLASSQDLGPAIQATADQFTPVSHDERLVKAGVWRDGEGVEVALAPGRMGVVLSEAPAGDGLRSMAFFDRSPDEQAANVTALEQIRLHGGQLSSLRGTRLEAEAVAAMFGDDATVLLDKDANAVMLRESIKAATPWILHLATHGLTGNARRPYEASLALTMPEEPTLDDIGFLTLDELIGQWFGRLDGCELVVLSACDTGRGVSKGDSVMSLPLGFFVAGAETVIASLWNVDDRATALLMTRFYENLLGAYKDERSIDGGSFTAETAMPKLSALREAKAWLRTLTLDERDTALARLNIRLTDVAGARGDIVERDAADTTRHRPYAHPRYWAAFVLYGNPG